MLVTIGRQLGSLEILALLGRGGMGEVYRARDAKLKREVAIKILPDKFSRDPDRVSRLQREAEVLASLNHPNIAAIYDLQEANGSRFLVLELVEGETLAEGIKRGPIPIDEALGIAKQIAEALEAAHDKGVNHRDLKPANVKITPDGKVKVLDFGLAKAYAAESANVDFSNSPTMMSMAATNAGVILGTAAYMSPEQARGEETDERSDVFSFGCVLYEMLTGCQAFQGKTVSDILASVLKVEADWSTLPKNTPAAIRHLLERCLRKDRTRRLQTAADVRIEIEDTRNRTETITPAEKQVELQRPRLLWIVTALLFFLATGVLAAVIVLHREPDRLGLIRMTVSSPDKVQIPTSGRSPDFAISPNGRFLAFAGVDDAGKGLLWVRSFDSLSAQPLTETTGASIPFWSQDSGYIGFFSGGKLKKVAVSGGVLQTVGNASPSGGTWSRNGIILFGSRSSGLFRVSDAGGEATPVTTLNQSRKETAHLYPQFLPDGRHFIYLAKSETRENTGIYVGSLDDTQTKLLVRSEVRAAYASGYLLFVRDLEDTPLMAQPFDSGRQSLISEPVRIAEQVRTTPGPTGGSDFAISENGVLAYRRAGIQNTQLLWFDRSGKSFGGIRESFMYRTHAVSPDGKRVAVHRHDPVGNRGNIWIYDPRGASTRLTLTEGHDYGPLWSPDGARIVYSSIRGSDTIASLYQKDSTGAGNEQLLLKTGENLQSDDWSRDGRFIIYESASRESGLDLWILPMTGDAKPIPSLKTQFNERKASFSPDGKWVAYTSNESGRDEVYIQAFPTSGGKRLISPGGGSEPQWRGDGKELFYVAAETRSLTAVPIRWTPNPEAGAPEKLFPASAMGVDAANQYSVLPSGLSFLVNAPSMDNTARDSVTVLFNWTDNLKK